MDRCELVAEIGWNHMGDMSLAEKMISEASKSGAEYCKFQTWKVKNLKDGPWNTDGRLEIYNKAELSDQDHSKLVDLCKKNKVHWRWVKGHSTNKYNNLADELATEAIKN